MRSLLLPNKLLSSFKYLLNGVACKRKQLPLRKATSVFQFVLLWPSRQRITFSRYSNQPAIYHLHYRAGSYL